MECFWGGLDESIDQLMPGGEPRWTLAEYTDLARLLSRSPLSVASPESSPIIGCQLRIITYHGHQPSPPSRRCAEQNQSPPMTESLSPPQPTSHCIMGRQSWGSSLSQNMCRQTKCGSWLQSLPWGRSLLIISTKGITIFANMAWYLKKSMMFFIQISTSCKS